MIRKIDRNLLKWIQENITDFEDKNDESGLSWDSTHKDALEFLHSIPKKERVQKFGFYSSRIHFFLVEDFDDIKYCLKKGLLSEKTCSIIYQWNREVGRENWNMDDVNELLNPKVRGYRSRTKNFLYSTLEQLMDLGVMECVNPEVETGKLFKLTEKGERILKEI